MRNNSWIRLGILCIAFAAASCAPKKRVVTSAANTHEVSRTARLEVIARVDRHRLDFMTFSGRAKARVVMNKDDYDLTANVRIRRDSAIWISVTALMGVEAGRILITPDSIKLVNRLRSEYLVEAFEHVHRFTDARLNFYDLQAMLVGNVPQGAIDGASVWTSSNGHELKNESGGIRWDVLIDSDSRPVRTEMETDRDQLLEAAYGNYGAESGRLFPNRFSMTASADALNLRSEMNFTRVSFDEVLEMPFSIPSTYREIR